jgi:ATP-binding cassette, subfamily C (CFTR/MRP), member 1
VLQFTTRLLADVETRFTSVERISTYVNTLPAERAALIPDKQPPPEWPTKGACVLVNVWMRPLWRWQVS